LTKIVLVNIVIIADSVSTMHCTSVSALPAWLPEVQSRLSCCSDRK